MLEKKHFQRDATKVMEWIDDYFAQLESLPVKSKVKPKAIYEQIPAAPPESSEDLDQILQDLSEVIVPGITHWQHPNFHAYFPANSSLESVLAEFITAAIGAQCMIWDTSPAAAELEERVMEWLRDAMGLPANFEGVIQDTASSATLVAILTAREVKTDFRANEDGVPNNLRVYCSTETHSSIEKAVGISGIGKKNLVKIPVDEKMRLRADLLEARIREDLENGLVPCCVVAAIGTTGTVAVDPLPELAAICEQYGVWLHVDAAYAGTALLLPEYQWMIEGIDRADSFVFNPHKWMFTNFDCTAYFVKDVDVLIRAFEVLPEYLKTKSRGLVNDYRDWGIPLGRRFRALKLWFVIRSFGMEGLRKKLRHHIALNEKFAAAIGEHPEFELVIPPFLNYCAFRWVPQNETDEARLNACNEQLLDTINKSGKLFLSHTKIGGKYVLRMVIGQTYVEERHVLQALEILREATKMVPLGRPN
ncbi:pyridoxal phosphate-dependent decarboxylase family protein [Flavilitoribacter nigricans]|uniref:Aspartate aminotransferase family protein n=1 Tax=Flavilitoribacter nigricans (strain ATCC 23147 / DSM 23189 / NBRC 102662 / NCIMB 1420 / SS-2) TaxID=1122177 RepID=A0A2D0NAL5_FLAN2|nr:aminotransferase class I/II-fold pyridoxal phosphate-dependent enzyme [Flavilitoribacter nigricans]PHN05527.1 aspartate aminotransferase family protein [Flavilitoribacter nigricans DSM 23189 = NBRC 102662]